MNLFWNQGLCGLCTHVFPKMYMNDHSHDDFLYKYPFEILPSIICLDKLPVNAFADNVTCCRYYLAVEFDYKMAHSQRKLRMHKEILTWKCVGMMLKRHFHFINHYTIDYYILPSQRGNGWQWQQIYASVKSYFTGHEYNFQSTCMYFATLSSCIRNCFNNGYSPQCVKEIINDAE